MQANVPKTVKISDAVSLVSPAFFPPPSSIVIAMVLVENGGDYLVAMVAVVVVVVVVVVDVIRQRQTLFLSWLLSQYQILIKEVSAASGLVVMLVILYLISLLQML